MTCHGSTGAPCLDATGEERRRSAHPPTMRGWVTCADDGPSAHLAGRLRIRGPRGGFRRRTGRPGAARDARRARPDTGPGRAYPSDVKGDHRGPPRIDGTRVSWRDRAGPRFQVGFPPPWGDGSAPQGRLGGFWRDTDAEAAGTAGRSTQTALRTSDAESRWHPSAVPTLRRPPRDPKRRSRSGSAARSRARSPAPRRTGTRWPEDPCGRAAVPAVERVAGQPHCVRDIGPGRVEDRRGSPGPDGAPSVPDGPGGPPVGASACRAAIGSRP